MKLINVKEIICKMLLIVNWIVNCCRHSCGIFCIRLVAQKLCSVCILIFTLQLQLNSENTIENYTYFLIKNYNYFADCIKYNSRLS